MMNVGIEKIGFDTADSYLDLTKLAIKRGVDPNKYVIGIGQDQQAILRNSQDIVTMACNAAARVLSKEDKEAISMLMMATESGIDNSKSSAVYVANLLGLSAYIKTIEVKQACYSATFALMQACEHVKNHPKQKVLVIASDISRYGLNTPGEVTQGAGAVAMLVSADAKVLKINTDSVYKTEDVMDFWRPLDSDVALVDGHYSRDVYTEMFAELWGIFKEKFATNISDFDAFLFHLPFTKMGKKALDKIIDEADKQQQELLKENLFKSQILSRQVGNIYTGSLYMSLLSLLLNAKDVKHIGLFSYGSGAEGELYQAEVVDGYQDYIYDPAELLAARTELSVEEYEDMFNSHIYGSDDVKSHYETDDCEYVFLGVKDKKRLYKIN